MGPCWSTCGIVDEVSLETGFEVSKVHARPSMALSFPVDCGYRCRTPSNFSSYMST